MKELSETIKLMQSADYKERFAAEYYQLETRYLKLSAMVKAWDEGTLTFKPTCPREMYDDQLNAMFDYLCVLIDRAKIEGVNLEVSFKC